MFKTLSISWSRLLCITSLLLSGCDAKITVPSTYEDCLLEYAKSALTKDNLATVKSACMSKFPKVFDFDSIGRQADVASWEVVSQKADFQALDDEAKSQARQQYFVNVVSSRVNPDYIADANAQFDAFTRKIERMAHAQSMAASAPKRVLSDSK